MKEVNNWLSENQITLKGKKTKTIKFRKNSNLLNMIDCISLNNDKNEKCKILDTQNKALAKEDETNGALHAIVLRCDTCFSSFFQPQTNFQENT